MKKIQKSDAEDKLKMSGLLLAGGNSSRMGKNKALLKIGDKLIIERSLEVIEGIFGEVLVSARDDKAYQSFDFRVIEDVFPGKGPLSGIYSGMQAAKFDYVFVTACDMPRLNPKAIMMLAENMEDFDIVVPQVSGKLHPLHAFYNKRIQKTVLNNLKEDRLKLKDLINECKTKVVQFEDYADSLININTPEELMVIQNLERMSNIEKD